MKNFAISLTCHARLLQAKSGVSSPEKVKKRFINRRSNGHCCSYCLKIGLSLVFFFTLSIFIGSTSHRIDIERVLNESSSDSENVEIIS